MRSRTRWMRMPSCRWLEPAGTDIATANGIEATACSWSDDSWLANPCGRWSVAARTSDRSVGGTPATAKTAGCRRTRNPAASARASRRRSTPTDSACSAENTPYCRDASSVSSPIHPRMTTSSAWASDIEPNVDLRVAPSDRPVHVRFANRTNGHLTSVSRGGGRCRVGDGPCPADPVEAPCRPAPSGRVLPPVRRG